MSEHEQPKPSEGIVTSDTAQGKKHLPKKTLLVGGVVIIILLAVTCLVLYRYHHQSTNNAPVTTSNNIPTTQQLKAAITNSQADVKNAKTPAQKAGAYQSLGNNYPNNSETTYAIVAFNNAIAADSTIKLGVLRRFGL